MRKEAFEEGCWKEYMEDFKDAEDRTKKAYEEGCGMAPKTLKRG